MNYNDSVNYLKNSPLFNLSLSSKELFHSNFLYWIWKISPSAFKDVMNSFGAKTNQWPPNYEVRREYENFDLCVLDANNNILLVLENKVKSIPYKKQLDEYEEKVQKLYGIDGHIHELAKGELTYYKKRYQKGDSLNPQTVNDKFYSYDCYCKVDFILLTLPKGFPDEADIAKAKIWKIIYYSTYQASVLNINFTNTYNQDIVNDYSQFLDALISLYNEWHNNCYTQLFVNNTSPNPDYVKDAVELRIHDLYHKSKYARICTDLQIAINNLGYSEVENNDDVILKQSGNCIAFGYGFSKGSPFVEVKIKPAGLSPIFAIQIQGKQYRHAVVMGHGGGGNSNIWNNIKCYDNNGIVSIGGKVPYDWMRYNIQQVPNPTTVLKSGLINSCLFANQPLYPVKNEYLKFVGAKSTIGMIYQYRELCDNVTTQNLIDYIVEDVKMVIAAFP